MKVKILFSANMGKLQDEINDFIAHLKVIDIKFTESVMEGENPIMTAYILYDETKRL